MITANTTRTAYAQTGHIGVWHLPEVEVQVVVLCGLGAPEHHNHRAVDRMKANISKGVVLGI